MNLGLEASLTRFNPQFRLLYYIRHVVAHHVILFHGEIVVQHANGHFLMPSFFVSQRGAWTPIGPTSSQSSGLHEESSS
jgi:hypothetical protein